MSNDHSVARYYDRNTTRFLRFGGGRGALAIHRELWAPGVRNAEEAKRTVNALLGDAIADQGLDAPTVLDLGCGVGGTLLDLALRFPRARLHGVTISPRQVEIAQRLMRERGLSDRSHIHLGDFQALELSGGHESLRADAVLAVESFAHASDAAAFFRSAAAHLRPGGVVLLVDDFLARGPEEVDERGRRLAQDFSRGWRLGPLRTPDEVADHASREALTVTADVDLTPLVRLGRPRDKLIRILAPSFSRLGLVDVPFFGNMIGGNALQEGLRSGVFSYRMLTLRAERT
jgi:SAM-dependent methyltransferase